MFKNPERNKRNKLIESGVLLAAGALALGSIENQNYINNNKTKSAPAFAGKIATSNYADLTSNKIRGAIVPVAYKRHHRFITPPPPINIAEIKDRLYPNKTSTSNYRQKSHQISKTTTPLSPLEKVQKYIYDFFLQKKLTESQSAGIDGNFGQESRWNPSQSGGFLAQWGGPRLSALEQFAYKERAPVTDLNVQLNYTWLELTNGSGAAQDYRPVLKQLKSTTTTAASTEVFMLGYESPNPVYANEAQRISDANLILKKFGGK